MSHTLTIKSVTPWSEYNEYEGQIDGLIDGNPVCCYIFAPNLAAWKQLTPGRTLKVDIWIERTGVFDIVDPTEPSILNQLDGVLYEIIGNILLLNEENVVISSFIPIPVDLDLPVRQDQPFPQLSIGDNVRLKGILKVDLIDDSK